MNRKKPWQAYRDFRERQRSLAASTHSQSPTADGAHLDESTRVARAAAESAADSASSAKRTAVAAADAAGASAQSAGASAAAADASAADAAGGSSTGDDEPDAKNKYGKIGQPLNKQSPFYIGLTGALGAMVGIGLWSMLGQLATTLTILVVALFLTLALNPIFEWLIGKGRSRTQSIVIVFAGVLAAGAALVLLVVPPVISEGSQLLGQAPTYVDTFLNYEWVKELDKNYNVIEKVQEEANKRLTDGSVVSRIFGGVLGAGMVLITGLFQAFTILILTLYFLASLPKVKKTAYAIVPLSRRPRFVWLSEEILRRVGGYAMGQAAVATVNALCSYVLMRILGIPYGSVLAVVVGLLGLIPMVGATIGAAIVVLVAFFDSPRSALIAAIYYVIYQQIENYVISPRIMSRTVAVPGAVTVVAALAGGTLLGVLGALLAIPVAAGLLLIYEEVLLPRQRRI